MYALKYSPFRIFLSQLPCPIKGASFEKFDLEHDQMLKAFGDEFVIPHRIIARVLTPSS
jgi:hypothetical protein